MARRVPGLASGSVQTFVPDVDGNRSDPNPVQIDYRVPTEAERRAFFSGRTRFAVDAKGAPVSGNGKVDVEVEETEQWQHRAVRLCVLAVRNYTDNADRPILTGADLATHGESEIVFPTANEILATRSGLSDDQKKSSAPRSGSSARETPPSDGTAPSAVPLGSTRSADAA